MSSTPLDRWLLERLHEGCGRPALRFALWDGTSVGPADGAPPTMRILDREMLLKVVTLPDLYFGEGYTEGRVEVEGDFLAFVTALDEAAPREPPGLLSWAASELLRLRNRGTPAGARDNIHRHYDMGNDFYALWLDTRLVYTCAYYRTPSDTLEDAQLAKMDHVCRKLRLAPGESVVEAGCGWGALALHMAAKYGVTVRAYNVSHEQIAYARDRAKAEGLSERVEFVEDDYRTIPAGVNGRRFDVFVSVGMLEHVGPERYEDFGRVIDGALTPAGRGLLHFIGRNRPRPLNAWTQRRIFPGAYIPSLRESLAVLEACDLSVLDVENLRLHYGLTLAHWLERFERSAARVEAMFDAAFVRAWRLYLAGSCALFRTGWAQLFQVVFARAANNDVPLTREHLYAGEPAWTPATR